MGDGRGYVFLALGAALAASRLKSGSLARLSPLFGRVSRFKVRFDRQFEDDLSVLEARYKDKMIVGDTLKSWSLRVAPLQLRDELEAAERISPGLSVLDVSDATFAASDTGIYVVWVVFAAPFGTRVLDVVVALQSLSDEGDLGGHFQVWEAT